MRDAISQAVPNTRPYEEIHVTIWYYDEQADRVESELVPIVAWIVDWQPRPCLVLENAHPVLPELVPDNAHWCYVLQDSISARWMFPMDQTFEQWKDAESHVLGFFRRRRIST
jgi:hypothetical protein